MTAVQSCELREDQNAVLVMGEGAAIVHLGRRLGHSSAPQPETPVLLDSRAVRWFLCGDDYQVETVELPGIDGAAATLDVCGLAEPPKRFVAVWQDGRLHVASGWGVVWRA